MSASTNVIGLLICRCSRDVKSVDYNLLNEYLKNLGTIVSVFFLEDLCKDPSIIRERLRLFKPQSMLVVGCMEYRDVLINEIESIGLNPLLIEFIPHKELFSEFPRDSKLQATGKLTVMIYSSVEKLKFIELARRVEPRRARASLKISRRSLFRSLPQFLMVYEPTPVVERDKCIGTTACSFCMTVCPRRALSGSEDGRVLVDVDKCSICGVCASICPTGAIQIPNATDEQIDAQVKSILQNFTGEIPNKIVMFIDPTLYREILEELIKMKASLLLELFPIELPTLGLISENLLLSTIAYGARGVIVPFVLGEDVSEYLDVLRRKTVIARKILESLGYSNPPIYLLEFRELKSFIRNLENLRNECLKNQFTIKNMCKSYPGDRRTKLISIVKDFVKDGKIVVDVLDYGEPCPFAEVIIDRELCTLCGLCYEKCPTKSFTLTKDVDALHLAFIYQKCLGCNLCASICPEKAITLKRCFSVSRLLDDNPSILISQELVKCSRCSKPFITKGKLRKLEKIYSGLGVEDTSKLQSLKLCPECRRSKIVPAEYDKWFIYR